MSSGLRGLFSFGSRSELPDDVRAALDGRRPLATTRAEDGTWLVGTRDALYAVASDEAGQGSVQSRSSVWPWEQVHRADWEDEARRLDLVPVADYGRPVEPQTFVLEDAADLLALVRERVSASVVLQRRVVVTGKRGFQVIARRPPQGGRVSWAFELDEGIDPELPEVREAMDQALADALAELGQAPG